MKKIKYILPFEAEMAVEDHALALQAALSLVDILDGETPAPNQCFIAYGSLSSCPEAYEAYLRPAEQFVLELGDVIVAMYGKAMPSVNLSALPEGHFFWINDSFQITTPDGRYNDKLTPGIKKHIFSKLLPDEVSAHGDFPFIQLVRDQRLRPITPIGHRIGVDLKTLKQRDNNHKVIALFGGSAAQGINVHSESMFAAQLQCLLNDGSRSERYTVLNFAVSGHIVTDEFLTYLFFCDALRPDMVVSFDGWNDMANGCVNDSYLVNEWRFTYRYKDEARAEFLNSEGKKAAPVVNSPLQPINTPAAIIEAYLHRLEQFIHFVQGRGICFLACLQPLMRSKKAFSVKENEALTRTHGNNPLFVSIYDQVLGHLFDNLQSPFKALPCNTVNFHKIFKELGAECDFFTDRVHFNARGEAYIAQQLAGVIKCQLG